MENYRWKADRNLLMLEIYEAIYMNVLTGEVPGTEELFTQFFEIIDQSENRIL